MGHLTLPETNIASENGPLEVWRFLLETIHFQGRTMLVSGEGSYTMLYSTASCPPLLLPLPLLQTLQAPRLLAPPHRGLSERRPADRHCRHSTRVATRSPWTGRLAILQPKEISILTTHAVQIKYYCDYQSNKKRKTIISFVYQISKYFKLTLLIYLDYSVDTSLVQAALCLQAFICFHVYRARIVSSIMYHGMKLQWTRGTKSSAIWNLVILGGLRIASYIHIITISIIDTKNILNLQPTEPRFHTTSQLPTSNFSSMPHEERPGAMLTACWVWQRFCAGLCPGVWVFPGFVFEPEVDDFHIPWQFLENALKNDIQLPHDGTGPKK